MENLEKLVEDLTYRGERGLKIEGDKLIQNYGMNGAKQHVEMDVSMFDFEQEREYNRDIFFRIHAASVTWVAFTYCWYDMKPQPISDVEVIVRAEDDVVETFTMSDIRVTLNLSLPEKCPRVEKYHFERNGKTLELTRDDIPVSRSHDRLQYVFEQLKQL